MFTHTELSFESNKMFSFLAIAVLVVAASADTIPLKNRPIIPDGRISGGKNAFIESYPYQISLEVYGRHVCGGSIISANYIVTAGHCAREHASVYTVRAGTSLRERGGSVHEVVKVVCHEKYFTSEYGVRHFDVGVIKVKERFVFDETRQPIDLFDLSEESFSGVQSVITGWGSKGKVNVNGLPVQLQTATIPIISKDLCDTAYKKYGGLPEGQICAGYYGVGGNDACEFDAGGPLAIGGRLAGIVSWRNGCAKPNHPGAYTEVAYFREWINEHAAL